MTLRHSSKDHRQPLSSAHATANQFTRVSGNFTKMTEADAFHSKYLATVTSSQ